ncbi:hypothetical protein J2W49_000183 [Hydrogenophaga palleronii]|uniref:Uncharacterized protein n=1 Tax=Hydrogenophaga palleronii TaxID=65655 RepID=A0ABU1WG56_9BURK|nr:hypothetical protein [Hydrogenophaga palleronii]MDR7148255.1 hypothetical protein [Hydrogenophaga palleronii]
MTIDDGDDKVRRNLVVFSALILASAWLGRPEMWLLSTLINVDAPPLAWRVTTLALSVLIYLVARYWFSQAHTAARSAMSVDWSRNMSRVRDTLIEKTLKNYHRLKKQPAFIETNLENYCRGAWSTWNGENTSDGELQFLTVHISPNDFWEGSISTTRHFAVAGKTGTSSGGNSLDFNFPPRIRTRIKATAAIHQVFYSRTAVEYFIPLALAYSALLVLLYRLARSLT